MPPAPEVELIEGMGPEERLSFDVEEEATGVTLWSQDRRLRC